MKRFVTRMLVLVLVSGLALLPAFAQTSSAPATVKAEQPPLSPEDVRNLREAAQMITDALQGKKQQSEPAPKVEKQPQKNMAEVADRALSILSGYIGSAEQAFRKVAPEVWRIMIRQQIANGIAGPLVPLALIGFITAFVVVVKRRWNEPQRPTPPGEGKRRNEEEMKQAESDYNSEWWTRFWMTGIIPGALYFLFGIWASVRIAGSIQMFINPEYYAFKDLLTIVLQKGGL